LVTSTVYNLISAKFFQDHCPAPLRPIQRAANFGDLWTDTSYILELLDDDAFRGFYLSGGFDPVRIMAFARPRGLSINRIAAPAPLQSLS